MYIDAIIIVLFTYCRAEIGKLSGKAEGIMSILELSDAAVYPFGGRIEMTGSFTVTIGGNTYQDQIGEMEGGRLTGEIDANAWTFEASLTVPIVFPQTEQFLAEQLYIEDLVVNGRILPSPGSAKVGFGDFTYTTKIKVEFELVDAPFTLEDEGTLHCGYSNERQGLNPNRRIVNGNEALAHQYPWMVYFIHNDFDDVYQRCGGILLTSEVVLTAAHNVFMPVDRADPLQGHHSNITDDLDKFEVYLGAHDVFEINHPDNQILRDNEILVQVEIDEIQIFPHNSFDEDTVYFCNTTGLPDPEAHSVDSWQFYDIALLFIREPTIGRVTLDYFKDVLCLPDQLPGGATFQEAFLAGWGRDRNLVQHYRLQVTTVDLIQPTQLECQTDQGDDVDVADLIVSNHQEQQEDTGFCFGDSGGPYFVKNDNVNDVKHFAIGVIAGAIQNSTGTLRAGECKAPKFDYGVKIDERIINWIDQHI